MLLIENLFSYMSAKIVKRALFGKFIAKI